MATSAKTLTSTAWVQISAGNVYIENKSWEPIYWVGASSRPNINTVLSSAHYLPAEMKELSIVTGGRLNLSVILSLIFICSILPSDLSSAITK